MDTEYDEGVAAYHAGYGKEACPYKTGSRDADAWCRGWVDTQDEDEGGYDDEEAHL